ncbi:PREDICTED: Retrovirus-related Pol poly from transposon, partial [Prunus dulcis]
NGAHMFKDFKKSMMEEFEMTDLGKMHYFLRIEVKQSGNGIFIGQKKYVEEILKRFHMEGCNSVQNPIAPGTKLIKDEGGEKVDNTHFKQI